MHYGLPNVSATRQCVVEKTKVNATQSGQSYEVQRAENVRSPQPQSEQPNGRLHPTANRKRVMPPLKL
jgi:hypothetical protein